MSGQGENQSSSTPEQTSAAPSETASNATSDTTGASNADSAVPDSTNAISSAAVNGSKATGETESAAADASSTAPSEAATNEASNTAQAESSKPKSQESKAQDIAGNADASSKTDHKPASKVEAQKSKADSTTGPPKSKSATSPSKPSATSRTGAEASPASSNRTRGSSQQRKRIKLGDLDLTQARIGFLGAGKIAESTINGLIHYGKISPSKIYVAAPSSKGLERLKALGCRVTKRNYDIFGRYDCDIVFLAFHGYVIKHCYKLGGHRPHPLCTNYIPHQRHPIYILSLVTGVSLGQIKAVLLNPESPNRYSLEIHRIMVNTAVGHGLGLCAIDCEPDSKKLSAPIRKLLSSIAQLEHVPATQMDAACAIGGSGLAFAYYFINALADGAFRMGLSRAQAIRFASKTAQCAAQTMLESGKHPAELRDNVSARSGAAIYGIHVLEKNDVASGVTAAVEAAHKRANDLATQDITTS